jgi:hypothetical protein
MIKGCHLSLLLCNIYIDRVIKDLLQAIKQNILIKDLILSTVLFADS